MGAESMLALFVQQAGIYAPARHRQCALMPRTAHGRPSGPGRPSQYGGVSADTDRSMARIEIADPLRLAALAAGAEAELFERHPDRSRRYAGRLLGRALCQALPCTT
jgi:hypothetical protein